MNHITSNFDYYWLLPRTLLARVSIEWHASYPGVWRDRASRPAVKAELENGGTFADHRELQQ